MGITSHTQKIIQNEKRGRTSEFVVSSEKFSRVLLFCLYSAPVKFLFLSLLVSESSHVTYTFFVFVCVTSESIRPENENQGRRRGGKEKIKMTWEETREKSREEERRGSYIKGCSPWCIMMVMLMLGGGGGWSNLWTKYCNSSIRSSERFPRENSLESVREKE